MATSSGAVANRWPQPIRHAPPGAVISGGVQFTYDDVVGTAGAHQQEQAIIVRSSVVGSESGGRRREEEDQEAEGGARRRRRSSVEVGTYCGKQRKLKTTMMRITTKYNTSV